MFEFRPIFIEVCKKSNFTIDKLLDSNYNTCNKYSTNNLQVCENMCMAEREKLFLK